MKISPKVIMLACGAGYIALLHAVILYLDPKPIYDRLFPPEPCSELSPFQYELTLYHSRKERNATGSPVLFLGSSSVQGLNVSYIGTEMVNLGIGGECISQLSKRIRSYTSIGKARAIVINTGHNDLVHDSPHAIADRLKEEILDRLPAQTPLILVGIQPFQKEIFAKHPTRSNTNITILNKLYQSICEGRQNCQYIDLGSTLNTAQQPCTQTEAYEKDGLHLSPLGYQCWQASIEQAMRTLSIK